MYLDLGKEAVVSAAEIVTILDARLAWAEANRGFLERAAARGVSEDVLRGCRSLVVTTRGVYPSSMSPQGLARRLAGGRFRGG